MSKDPDHAAMQRYAAGLRREEAKYHRHKEEGTVPHHAKEAEHRVVSGYGNPLGYSSTPAGDRFVRTHHEKLKAERRYANAKVEQSQELPSSGRLTPSGRKP